MTDELVLDEGSVTLTEAEAQEIVDRWNTYDDSEAHLLGMGITERQPPDHSVRPLTGDDLANLDPMEHAALQADYLNWFSYLAPQLAKVKAQLLQTENTIKALSAAIASRLRKERRDKKLTQNEIDMYVNLDPTMAELLINKQALTQISMSVTADVEVCKSNMAVISREIEVIRLDRQQTAINSNMPARMAAAAGGRVQPRGKFGERY